MFLTAADKQRIAEAIRATEAKTSGELVCVIAPASNDYRFLPLLWSVFIALCVPGIVWLSGMWWSEGEIYLAQVALFLLSATLFNWGPVKMRLVPRSVQRAQAARLAREQFYAQRLHRTREWTGVLLFVSVAEHYVEILADEGINAKVSPGTWDNIVTSFIAQVKQRQVAEGYLAAIASCGKILIENFPARVENPDELPNRLVEL